MANNSLQIKTKGGYYAKDIMAKVYFTCHPADFSDTFEALCNAVFWRHNCAVFYTEDMQSPLEEDQAEATFARMNLVVIPVTARLLREPNRAMRSDLALAKQHRIPILPIMMECGLESLYAKEENFGNIHYLAYAQQDDIAADFQQKLDRYLFDVLESDALKQEIQAGFDATVFLSYRKKDRRYVNQFITALHEDERFWKCSVWYDEYLIPGENFDDLIQEKIEKSAFVAFLVTPHVLEEPHKKPNYIIAHEYPAAKNAGKQVLPIEMVKTSRDCLEATFAELPACVCYHNKEEWRERFLSLLPAPRETSAEEASRQDYLIGRAYIGGIGVEIDRQRGLALVRKAAEAALPEAMRFLSICYQNGYLMPVDFQNAQKWAQKYYDNCCEQFGESSRQSLDASMFLAGILVEIGAFQQALIVADKAYRLSREIFGENHDTTISALNNLAAIYVALQIFPKAVTALEKVYQVSCERCGEDDEGTLIALSNLASAYVKTDDLAKAEEAVMEASIRTQEVLGVNHPISIRAMYNLIEFNLIRGWYQEALGLAKGQYELLCRVKGKSHPDALTTRAFIAAIYIETGDYTKAITLFEKLYQEQCESLGEEHPETLLSLLSLATAYEHVGNTEKAVAMLEEAYPLFVKVFGEEHHETLNVEENIVFWTIAQEGMTGELNKRLQEMYEKRKRVFGEEHPSTLNFLNIMAKMAYTNKNYRQALKIYKKLYPDCCYVLGETHPETVITLIGYVCTLTKRNSYKKALALGEKAYSLACEVLPEHLQEWEWLLSCLVMLYEQCGDVKKAIFFQQKLYERYCQNYDKAHEYTHESLLHLARLYGEAGDVQTAAKLFRKAGMP